MSTPPPPTAAPAPPAGFRAHLPVVAALVAGLVVGGASGAFVVGPAMASGIAPGGPPVARAASHDAEEGDHPAEDAAADEGADEGDGGDAEGAPKGEVPAHTIDNLVLNPAESGGTRFLLLTVTFEVRNAAVLGNMKARDAELRDAVLVALGTKTVEQLADMAHREQLKADLKGAATKLFKKGAIRRVYFPQFVIQ